MDYQEFTGRSTDEAITKACLQFGVPSDRLDYKVVREATSGFLGIGSKPAVISAKVKEEEKAQPEKDVRPAAAKKTGTEKEKHQPVRNDAENVAKAEEPENKKEQKQPKEDAAKETAGGRVLTNDVIEQRAAAAAAKAKAEGDEETTRPERRPQGGERRRRDDRRGRGRYDRPDRYRNRADEAAAPAHEPSKPKPERKVSPKTEEEVAAMTKTAEDFLSGVFKAMNVEVKMTASYDQKDGSLNVVFSGDEMGILIGKRGQTLDSLQYLTSLVVNKGRNEYIRVKLDTEDYRERREETLRNLARNIAYKVSRSHRPVSLEPMNPYERRVIHSALQSNRYVETYSEGEDPYRHVVVAPKSRR